MQGFDLFANAAAGSDSLALERGAMLIGAHGVCAREPGFPLPERDELEFVMHRTEHSLDQLATEVQAASAGHATVPSLMHHLFGIGRFVRFVGNQSDYYDPENSLLPRVLERGTGNPIALSCLAIAVGRRVGIELVGVGMPAHFLMRTTSATPRWIDPFAHGQVMSGEEVRAFFATVTGGRTPFHPSYIEPTPTPHILARMLANLQAIHSKQGNVHQLTWLGALSCALPASRPGATALAARRVEELGRFDVAAQLLDFASEHSAGSDREALESEAERIWARMN